jgi:hypothetical protein
MKGRIESDGTLSIVRKENGYVRVKCPIHRGNKDRCCCGNWCALFGEPYVRAVENGMRTKKVIYLELCHRSLMFEELLGAQ